MVKRLFAAAAFALLTAGAYAQVTVSAGFALSASGDVTVDGESTGISGDVGLGANIYFDYLLPISVPMSLGFELGYDLSVLNYDNAYGSTTENLSAVPLLLRVAYHFDLLSQLDLYLVGKIGYAIGEFTFSNIDNIGGFAIGIDAGAAYYFTSVFGIFGELGFDSYMLEGEGGYNNEKVKSPFNRFLTFGISTKF